MCLPFLKQAFHAVINSCMKINEVTSSLKTFIATVRVILQDNTTTATTSITAQTSSQAHMMLTRIYGRGNVLNVTQSVAEASETDQIIAPASFSHQHRTDSSR
jgi:hypothetical protein